MFSSFECRDVPEVFTEATEDTEHVVLCIGVCIHIKYTLPEVPYRILTSTTKTKVYQVDKSIIIYYLPDYAC